MTTRLSQALDILRKLGPQFTRAAVKAMFGGKRCVDRHRGSAANMYPQGHRAKRKRLQKIQKESRRRNRNS